MSHLSAAGAESEGDRAERLFIRQLTERQLFDLAEQHCRQRMLRAPDTDRQAQWQLRLCRTHLEHAWFAAALDRRQLLNHALQQLTDFLKDNVPTPARQFELRLHQARVLGQSIRMRIYLSEAGNLFGRGNQTEHTGGLKPIFDRLDPSLITVANRGIAITEGLLAQLDQIRADLSPKLAREFLNDGRLVSAELHCLKFQLQLSSEKGAADADNTLRDAETLLNLILRGVGNQNTKTLARWLSAELALWTGDSEQFNLKVSNQELLSDDDHQLTLLRVRSLLHQREASAASTLLSTSPKATAKAGQHLAWLQLEALLGRLELASQLQDPAFLKEATVAFATAHSNLRPALRGVFVECVERTVERFHLVAEVGTKVADVVEQVEFTHASGDVAAALRLIEVAISRLSTTQYDRPRAGLLLRAGEMLIDERKWNEALIRLNSSAVLYESLGESSRHAAADLLKVFTMAQLSAQGNQQGPAVTSQQYLSAIETHLSKFADQPTASRAQLWLLRHVRATDPLRAAMIALSMMDDVGDVDRKLELLLDCGRLLAAAPTVNPDVGRVDALQLFRKRANTMMSRSGEIEEVDLAPLILRVLSFRVAVQAPGSLDWTAVNTELSSVMSQFSMSRLHEDMELFEQIAVLEAVTAARIASTQDRLDAALQQLLTLNGLSLVNSIKSLHDQFSNDQPAAGDVWLARATESLIRRLLAEQGPRLTAKTALFVLPVVITATQLTGDHKLHDEILQAITEQSFDNSILLNIADTLVLADGATERTEAINPGVRRFWLNINESNPPGSDSWLEASLQLAKISALEQKPDEAIRRLGVVQALYPGWGSAARKQRAVELTVRLESIQ
jgi:tetratricopeptide (TPR) repeat protein